MPTCFLKRVLPFLLTLIIGVTLWTFLRPGDLGPSQVLKRLELTGSLGGSEEVPEEARVFRPSEVDEKARVISRPEPRYTEEARENLVEGTVVLRAVFSATGEVTIIRLMSGLPYGLNGSAIEAAQQIRFKPAFRDGRAVSQYIQIEYNFSLF